MTFAEAFVLGAGFTCGVFAVMFGAVVFLGILALGGRSR